MSKLPAAVSALKGCIVTRLVIDDALALAACEAGRELTLRIDGAGRFIRAGEVHAFDCDRDPMSVAPLIRLLNERIERVALADDGTLELATRDASLAVEPHDHQMTWSICCASGERASCIAEGRVVWE